MLSFRAFLAEAVETHETRYTEGDDPRARYTITATHDGAVVGSMTLIDYGDHLKVHDVFVHGDQRGKGFGKALYQHALTLARRIGRRELRSDYHVSDDAARVWRALGGSTYSDGGVQRWRLMTEGWLIESFRQGFIDPSGKELPSGGLDHTDQARRILNDTDALNAVRTLLGQGYVRFWRRAGEIDLNYEYNKPSHNTLLDWLKDEYYNSGGGNPEDDKLYFDVEKAPGEYDHFPQSLREANALIRRTTK